MPMLPPLTPARARQILERGSGTGVLGVGDPEVGRRLACREPGEGEPGQQHRYRTGTWGEAHAVLWWANASGPGQGARGRQKI